MLAEPLQILTPSKKVKHSNLLEIRFKNCFLEPSLCFLLRALQSKEMKHGF